MIPRQVLMISKPIVPPWNDSAKNIVRDQVVMGKRYGYRVMTTPGAAPLSPNVSNEAIYSDGGRFAAGLRQNARVMLAGIRPRGASIYHYFFAPNTLTSTAGRIQRLTARVPTVQTACSAPSSFDRAAGLVFTDMLIVLSRDTEQGFLRAGVSPSKIRRIAPGIRPIDPPDEETRAAVRKLHRLKSGPVFIFPGDYEFSRAADTVAGAAGKILTSIPESTLIFACRIKRDASREIQDGIKRRLADLGDRVVFLNEVDHMPALVGACDMVLLPSESLFAKMDVPLVLLEAMSQKVPIIIADSPPLDELLETGSAMGIPPADPDGLAEAVVSLWSDVPRRSAMGEAGARAVKDKFSAGNMAASVEDVYDEILGR